MNIVGIIRDIFEESVAIMCIFIFALFLGLCELVDPSRTEEIFEC
jgi:hypothetical protein